MSTQHKVVWAEGMFIRPQHFQQQDNYFEYFINKRINALINYGWGLLDFSLDESLLEIGQLALLQARGIMPDGTAFDMPAVDALPAAIAVEKDCKDQLVYLALPLKQDGTLQIAATSGPSLRYQSHEYNLTDITSEQLVTAPIQLAKLNFKLCLHIAEHLPFLYLPIAKIQEVSAEKKITLDKHFIPPCLDFKASAKLKEFIHEILATLRHRSEILQQRLGDVQRSTSALMDWLMLQFINRTEVMLLHQQQKPVTHPEALFTLLLQLASELATFNPTEKKLTSIPAYLHDDLFNTFHPLIITLRRAMNIIIAQTALSLPLEEHKYGIKIAPLSDISVLENANLILAVSSALSNETLVHRFPAQVKIGSVTSIKNLITAQLPGIKLQPLPTLPPQIPYHIGSNYFELTPAADELKTIRESGGIAIHVSGEFPELKMELWAVRENS